MASKMKKEVAIIVLSREDHPNLKEDETKIRDVLSHKFSNWLIEAVHLSFVWNGRVDVKRGPSTSQHSDIDV